VPAASKESLFKKIFPSFSGFQFSLSVASFLIPTAIVLVVLLIGGGGTYIVASNIFKNKNTQTVESQISEDDIPRFTAVATPTRIPPSPTPTTNPDVVFSGLLTQTPTPIIDPAGVWISYIFQPLSLTFKYPPGWYVSVSSSSGPPALNVQNFSPNSPVPIDTDGIYQIQISRFPQVGITSVSQLTSQLAVNEANPVYINGVNMGLVTTINSGNKTINGNTAYERTISYSNSPFSNVYQLFVLDGSGNVVQFVPAFDTIYGQSYFNTFVTTITF
jgi:hypothetical protein